MRYIDLHTHLAWAIDDGYASLEETKQGLEILSKQGTVGIVATPHFIPGKQDLNDIKKMNERINELREVAKEYNVQVIRGCELFLNDQFLEFVDASLANTINHSKYLLCEFNVTKKLGNEDDVEERLYELSIRNFTPIIAHVERYFHEGVDIERVRDWVNQGYIIQMNGSSILGGHGTTIRNNCFKLLDEGLVHIISSDTHGPKGGRNPILKDVCKLIEKQYGKENAQKLFYDNALHVIKNEEVEQLEKVKRSFFKKIFRKG